MRIISGKFKGRQLRPPGKLPVRPTTDFAKTGLFNLLASRVDFHGLVVVDLFAGTGSLSYEFISREARIVYSVDKHPGCIQFIRDTVSQMKATDQSAVYCTDVFRFLERFSGKVDIIVADAPFEKTPAEEINKLVFEKELLQPEGLLIIEHETGTDFSALPNYRGSRKYGNVTFSFYSLDGALTI